MPDKRKPQQREDLSRTGIMPRPIIEPDEHHEPKHPTTLPEEPDEAATTGTLPIITEGQDTQAERDSDTPIND